MGSLKHVCMGLILSALTTPALALDPRDPAYEFKYTAYPPNGISVKKTHLVPREPANKGQAALVLKTGKFPEWAQWYYTIGSDPKAFEIWWMGYWTDPNIWHYTETPCFKGYQPGNQGHRIIAFLHTVNSLIQKDPDINPEVKASLCPDSWKAAVEDIIREKTIDPQTGLLCCKAGDSHVNQGNMAQTFHFIRSKYNALGLRIPRIYSLELAQSLTCTLLTAPNIICEEDKWMTPPNDQFLENLGFQKGGLGSDIRIVKNGKLLYTGGLFIGWNDKPSLHGTWDGLAILNCLFKYYDDPDPRSSRSIFYKWNQLPEEKKLIGKKMIQLCAARLWLDWKERNKPIWCWVRDAKPTDDDARPSQAPWMPAYDGYGDNQFGWAKQCWDELFGEPMRNTTNGCQAFLAIANGTVLKPLCMPVGQQVPDRGSFDRNEQIAAIDLDRKSLDDPKVQKTLLEKYGLTPDQARKRIDEYYVHMGLPPGQTPASETPRLDPAKSNAANSHVE